MSTVPRMPDASVKTAFSTLSSTPERSVKIALKSRPAMRRAVAPLHVDASWELGGKPRSSGLAAIMLAKIEGEDSRLRMNSHLIVTCPPLKPIWYIVSTSGLATKSFTAACSLETRLGWPSISRSRDPLVGLAF